MIFLLLILDASVPFSGTMIDIRHLKHFIAVVEAGGIRPAVQIVHLSPSSVLRSIQQIEEHYSVSLFDKNGKGQRLTPFGEQLLQEARTLTAGFDSIAPKLAQVADIASGSLRVGLAPGVADLLGAGVMARLISDYPSVELSITIETADILSKQLQLQQLDLIVAYESSFIGQENLKIYRICSIDPGWWVRKNHPLLENKTIKMNEISAYPLLAQHLEPLYHNRLEEVLRTADLTGGRRVSISQCNSYRLLCETALRSDAILLAPQLNYLSGNYARDLRQLNLPVDMPKGWFSAAHQLLPSPSPLALRFIEIIKEEAVAIVSKVGDKVK